MAQQWKVDDLLQEIEHLEQLQCRPRGKNLMDKMVNSLEGKFKCIPNMTPGIGLKLMDAVDESKLDHEVKEKLLKILDECQGPSSNLRLTSSQQAIRCLPMYLSQQDWAKLNQATMTRDACEVLVARLKQMGLVSMKEDVKAQAIAIVIHWMDSRGIVTPDPWPLYYLVKDFNKMFVGSKITSPVASLASYPGNPMDLGEQWLSKVYGTDQPACKDLPLAMYLSKIPLRSTSQLLKSQMHLPKRTAVPTPQQSLVPVPGLD